MRKALLLIFFCQKASGGIMPWLSGLFVFLLEAMGQGLLHLVESDGYPVCEVHWLRLIAYALPVLGIGMVHRQKWILQVNAADRRWRYLFWKATIFFDLYLIADPEQGCFMKKIQSSLQSPFMLGI